MALKVNNIAVAGFGLRSQEMVERNFIEGRSGRECGNVSANAFLDLVGAHDHGKRIPADQALDAALHFLTAGDGSLRFGIDGVLVRSRGGKRKINPRCAARVQGELLK